MLNWFKGNKVLVGTVAGAAIGLVLNFFMGKDGADTTADGVVSVEEVVTEVPAE